MAVHAGDAYVDIFANTAPLSKQLAALPSSRIGKQMESMGRSLSKSVTLPLVGLGAAAVKMSLDFHKSMTLVQTQAGASAKEVDRMTKAILKFSASGQTDQGPKALADALYAIESAGIHGAKAMKTLKSASDLAMIGQADFTSTTKALVAAQKTGIKGSANLKKEIGTLNATVGAGQMHMDDLVGAMGTGFLASARGVGLSLRDVGGALAEMTKQGMPAAAAATRLRMTFTLMAAPTDKAKAALKGIGLGASDLANTMRSQGLLPALELLKSHLDGLSKTQQFTVLSGAFGGARSGSTIIGLLNNLGDLDTTLTHIRDHSGEVNKSLAAAKATKAEELKIAWAQLQSALVQLGDALVPVVIPALQKMAGWVQSISNAFEGLSPGMKSFVIDVGLGVAALGPLMSIGGRLSRIYGGVALIIRKAAEAFGLLSAAETAAGAAGGPIRGIAGGAGASGVARWLGTDAAPATAATVGVFGEKQAMRDAGLIGAGGASSRAGWLAKMGLRLGPNAGAVLPVTIAIVGAIGMDKLEKKFLPKNVHTALNTGGGSSAADIGLGSVSGDINALTGGSGGNTMAQLEKGWRAQHEAVLRFRADLKSLGLDAIDGMNQLNVDLRDGLDTANQRWRQGTAPWHQHTAEAMTATVSAIAKGMSLGVIPVKQGQREINQLLAKIRLISATPDDAIGLGRQMAQSFKRAGTVTSAGVDSLIGKLKQMAPASRQAAIDSVTGMLQKWAQGRPKIAAQVDALKDKLIGTFGATNHQIAKGVSGLVVNIAQLFGNLGTVVTRAIGSMGTEINSALKGLGVQNKRVRFTLAAGIGDIAEAGLNAILGKASGGAVSVPGTGLQDTVPLLANGAVSAMVAPGEDLVVLNRHQRPMVDAALAASYGVNGLPGFFNRYDRPHYMARGGIAHPTISGPDPLRSLGQGAIDKVFKAAQMFLQAHKPKGGGIGTGFHGPWVAVMQQIAKAKGWSIGDWRKLIMQESGGNPNAVNPSSGAFGLGQFLGSTAQAYAKYGALSHDPAKQIVAMAHYIADRYGNPTTAWAHETSAGWYTRGGIPVFAGGGFPQMKKLWKGVGPSGLQSGIRSLAGYVMDKYPSLSVSSTTGGTHASGSLHYTGQAVDLVGSALRAASEWIKSSGLYKALAEGIHNPNLSVEDGNFISPSYWGSATWADHTDHIHLGVTHPWNPSDLGAGSSGASPSIPAKGHASVPGGATGRGGGTSATQGHTGVSFFTKKLSFGPDPTTPKEATKELALRRDQLAHYKFALLGTKDSGERQAIRTNINLLIARISKLVRLRARLVVKAHQASVAKAISSRPEFTDWVNRINEAGTNQLFAQQEADRAIALEPSNATSSALAGYKVDEIFKYVKVLDAELSQRNLLLGAISFAGQTSAGMSTEIKQIQALKGVHPHAYKKRRFRIPFLTKAIAQIASFIDDREGDLAGVQGLRAPRDIWPAGALQKAGNWLTFGGPGNEIFDTQKAIADLGLNISNATSSDNNSELTDLYKQLALQANQRLLVQEAHDAVFSSFGNGFSLGGLVKVMPPYAGTAHTGAIVPGPPTQEKTMVVKGGEGIFTQEQMAAMGIQSAPEPGDTHVHLHLKPGTEWLRDFIDVRVQKANRGAARLGGSGMQPAGVLRR